MEDPTSSNTAPSTNSCTSNNNETLFSTEFSRYVLLEKLKSMEMDKYNLDTSIRLYIREFEAQARLVGIEDFNILINYISKYMPPLIRQWIPTQDASKRTNWKKLKDLLIDQFGLSLEDE
jgi:hypothetical protein